MKRSLASLLSMLILQQANAGIPQSDWPVYGGDSGSMHHSNLTQITKDNVKKLKVAWIYHTGDLSDGTKGIAKTTFETTPIIVDQLLYFCSGFSRIFALDAATGKEKWIYDANVMLKTPPGESKHYDGNLTCRGVSAWVNQQAASNSVCRTRIFIATIDGRLIAVDGRTGKACTDFGKNGQIDLNQLDNKGNGRVGVTSAPVIYDHIIITGTSIGDNVDTNRPHGIVRAFDTMSGKEIWNFDPIPAPLSHLTGAANVWAPISIDAASGVVYIPTSSPSPDYYGALRKDPMPYTNAVVALDARTGKPKWSFQTVHHNLWDYDIPASPTLISVKQNGQSIPAVAQVTKTGFVFFLDRVTGKPIYPVEERAVPQSTVPGETTSPTQPFPVVTAPISAQSLTPDDAWGMVLIDKWLCKKKIASYDNQGIFTPPSVRGNIVFPSFGGGTNWGSAAFDPVSGILIANSMNLAAFSRLIPRNDYDAEKKAHPDFEFAPMRGTPYGMERSVLFSPFGVPCNSPPWGMLTGIDVNTGKVLWTEPFGAVKQGPFTTFARWGSPNMGGPMTTASGLTFIGASMDHKFHAYETATGKLLWEGKLPADGMANPMTYMVNGKQYVAIAAGGHGALGTFGDSLVVYTLED